MYDEMQWKLLDGFSVLFLILLIWEKVHLYLFYNYDICETVEDIVTFTDCWQIVKNRS